MKTQSQIEKQDSKTKTKLQIKKTQPQKQNTRPQKGKTQRQNEKTQLWYGGWHFVRCANTHTPPTLRASDSVNLTQLTGMS